MVTPEQIESCKKCFNIRYDGNGEIICRYTNKAPDFKQHCVLFDSAYKSEDASVFDEFEAERNSASAGNWIRLANNLLDMIGIYIFMIIFVVFFGIIMKLTDSSAFGGISDTGTLMNYLIGFIAGTIYYTLFEYFSGGRSFGKFITKTKVITLDGGKLDFKTVLIRSLCRYIPLEPFSFFGSTDMGWHDSISKTRVVKI